jgi:hypothetical protein
MAEARLFSYGWPDGDLPPGQGEKQDLLICNYEDYGAGAISLITLDASRRVKSEGALIQTWTYPGWRSVEKQKHCSSSGAAVKMISFDSIEISVVLNSFDVDPPINCFDESESTTSRISNSRSHFIVTPRKVYPSIASTRIPRNIRDLTSSRYNRNSETNVFSLLRPCSQRWRVS